MRQPCVITGSYNEDERNILKSYRWFKITIEALQVWVMMMTEQITMKYSRWWREPQNCDDVSIPEPPQSSQFSQCSVPIRPMMLLIIPHGSGSLVGDWSPDGLDDCLLAISELGEGNKKSTAFISYYWHVVSPPESDNYLSRKHLNLVR